MAKSYCSARGVRSPGCRFGPSCSRRGFRRCASRDSLTWAWPSFRSGSFEAEGTLVPVLPTLNVAPIPLSAIYVRQRTTPARVGRSSTSLRCTPNTSSTTRAGRSSDLVRSSRRPTAPSCQCSHVEVFKARRPFPPRRAASRLARRTAPRARTCPPRSCGAMCSSLRSLRDGDEARAMLALADGEPSG